MEIFKLRQRAGGMLGAAMLAFTAPAMAQAPAAAPAASAGGGVNMIETIRARGQLLCGVSTGLAGFAHERCGPLGMADGRSGYV